MRVTASFLVIISLFVFTTIAEAGRQKPIVDFENQNWVREDGIVLPLEKVKIAIQLGLQDKGWNVDEWTDGGLTAKIVVRGKHTVIVTISYSTDYFSLFYKDSDNMLYEEEKDGTKVIHKNYSRWAEMLVDSIRYRLINIKLD